MSVVLSGGGGVIVTKAESVWTVVLAGESPPHRIGWTVAMELRPDNPFDRIGPALGAQNYTVRRMKALPHREVTSAIGKVWASDSKPVVKLAFELLVLTATRSGEVRGAAWTEIDLDDGVWIIPAGRSAGEVRWCLRACVGSASTAPRSPDCSRGFGSRRCRTVSGRRFEIGQPKRPTIPVRWRRRRWPMWSATKSRSLTGARTCSSGGGDSMDDWADYLADGN